jgi:ATP-dependent RNA helicase RhlE
MKDMELTTFSELGLNADLLKALAAEGYTVPTPIQAQAIPSVMAGRDLQGIAQTGTGKTAAFALPILHRLAANRRPAPRHHTRVLVLSPTRELAAQIADSFKTYGRHTGLTVAVMYGGVAHRPQTTAMSRGVDILVATPGRLIDHLDQRSVVLSGTEILVLDEADQMLDMGFIRPIRQIVSKLSQRRQSLFFSATMPKEIGALAAELLRDPVRVSVAPVATTVDRVRQSVIHIEPQKKASLLVELFADPAMKRTLVFTRTKRGADKVARHLEAAGIIVSAIHGNKSQRQREEALEDFRAGRIRGLVATDIAARGIDVDEVSHVVNFELPNVPESYVHRIGRTARAGAEGIAISLCGSEERPLLRDIERLTRQTIPSTNRSGDAGLATLGSDRGHGDGRTARNNGRPHAARPSGQRNGASNGHGHSHGHGGAPRNGASMGSRNGQRSGSAGDRHAGSGERHAGAGGGRGHGGNRGSGGRHASRNGSAAAKR